MTGRSNKKNHIKFGFLDTKEKLLVKFLKKLCYTNCRKMAIRKDATLPNHFGLDEHILWQLTNLRRDSIGLDKRYVNPELEINGVLYNENKGNYSTDLVVDYINDFIKRKKNQPFLVYYPMILTHCHFDSLSIEDWDPLTLVLKHIKEMLFILGIWFHIWIIL